MNNRTVEWLVDEYFVDEKSALKYYRNLKAADYAIDYAPIIKWDFTEDQTIKLLEKTHSYISDRANAILKSSLGFTPLEGDDIVFVVPLVDSPDYSVREFKKDIVENTLPQDFMFDYYSFFDHVGEDLGDDITRLPTVIAETLESGERYFQQIKTNDWLDLYDFSNKDSISEFNLHRDLDRSNLKRENSETLILSSLDKALRDNKGLDDVLSTTPSELKKGLLLKTDHLYGIIRRNKPRNSALAIKAGQRLLDNHLEANNLSYEQLFEKRVFVGDEELTDAVLDRYSSRT